MSLTLGLTGMDPATEAALRAAFLEANARLGDHWSLVADGDAAHVVVDMDSMYGPMSWLRLHAAGRHVIGLTSAPRTQTDYRLGRPFDVEQLMQLLADVARAGGVELAAGDRVVAAPAARAGAVPEAPGGGAAVDAAATPIPEPEQMAGNTSAEADPYLPAPEAAAAVAEPQASPRTQAGAEPEASPGTPSPSPPVLQPAPAAIATGRDLAAWLLPGALSGRVRFRSTNGTVLLIDPDAGTWHGPAALKSLAPCFEGVSGPEDFEPLDDPAWQREAATAGVPQPLARLRWLGGLLAGDGALLPAYAASDRFQLNKWPQTEREYPRHFRIATQMMKGPATLAEIAQASGVPEADVADFINANLATGFAEAVVETPPVAEEPVKMRAGLLGRLRSR